MSRRQTDARERRVRIVLAAQAAYFIATGVWPLLHRGSFEAVTGRKQDYWLVQTIGALVTVIGLVLARAAVAGNDGRRAPAIELAVGSAAALGAVEAWYAIKRRISWAYAADAVLEVAFIAAVLGARGTSLRR